MACIEEPSYISKVEYNDWYETIPNLLKRRAEEIPDKTAFIIYHNHKYEERISYGKLYEDCLKFATSLKVLGIKKGDIIVVSLRNSVSWLVIQYGMMMIGAVPLNSHVLRDDASDLHYVIEKSRPVAIVGSSEMPHLLKSLEQFIRRGGSDGDRTVEHVICVGENENRTFIKFADMVDKVTTPFDISDIHIDPDDLAIIMRSSGTTGLPKLVEHSHRTVTFCFSHWQNLSSDQIKISNLNFGWLGGTPLIEIITGSTAVSYTGNMGITAETLDRVFDCIREEKATTLSMSSPFLNLLSKMTPVPEFPPSLQTVIMGGSPIKCEWSAIVNKLSAGLIGYGCLEIGGIASTLVQKTDKIISNFVGNPFPGSEVKIVDENMQIVPRNTMGNIYARNPFRFLCYHGDNEMTDSSITKANWYNTRDVGYIDVDGGLHVIGRGEDVVSRGVMSTQCNEIEHEAKKLNIRDISDLVVVPAPDDDNGQGNCFCVIVEEECRLTEKELYDEICTKIFDDYYQPHYLIFVDSFSYNANGKLDRKLMTQKAADELKLRSATKA